MLAADKPYVSGICPQKSRKKKRTEEILLGQSETSVGNICDLALSYIENKVGK